MIQKIKTMLGKEARISTFYFDYFRDSGNDTFRLRIPTSWYSMLCQISFVSHYFS